MRRHVVAALALSFALLPSVGCRRQPEAGAEGLAPAVAVTNIDIGRSLNADMTINDNTANFKPNDTIYISVATEGSASSATLSARWTYQDGQVVDQSTQSIAPTGPARTEFHISKPDGWPAGKYRVEVTLNGVSAGGKDFEVSM